MELKRKVLNLKFDGQDFALKFPTVKQIKELTVKKEDESDLDMTVRFLSELGLPEATTLDMEKDGLYLYNYILPPKLPHLAFIGHVSAISNISMKLSNILLKVFLCIPIKSPNFHKKKCSLKEN